MKEDLYEELELPEGVAANKTDAVITIKGPEGEVKRELKALGVNIGVEKNKITLAAKKATKREKKMLYTYRAHIKNMVLGVQKPWEYKLKICSGHFPISAEVKNKTFILKNFLGEKMPRESAIPENVEVSVSGADITITSPDKELAGKTASNFEQLTRITDKDLRRFQDGVYIIEKPGQKAS